jgi:hypothetical protein
LTTPRRNVIIYNMKHKWTYSSVGQSTRLITGMSQVQVLVGPPLKWGVVQLAVRRTVNPEVVGSNPAAPATAPLAQLDRATAF